MAPVGAHPTTRASRTADSEFVDNRRPRVKPSGVPKEFLRTADPTRVESFSMPPGLCAFTDKSGPGFDTGVRIPMGVHDLAVYVNDDFVGFMAQQLGWLSPLETERLQALVQSLSDENNALKSKLDGLRQSVMDAIDTQATPTLALDVPKKRTSRKSSS